MIRRRFWFGLLPTVIFLGLLYRAGLGPGLRIGSYGDTRLYHEPLKRFAWEHLACGEIPLWNPHIFGGMPFLATHQPAVFYPGQMLSWTSIVSESFGWLAFFHSLMAGLGMALLVRTLGIGGGGPLWAGLLYGASPYLLYHLVAGHLTIFQTFAWAPYVLILLGSGNRPAPGIVVALLFLAGHAQAFYLVVLFAALWIALRWARRKIRTAELGRTAGSGLLGLALAGMTFLPVMELALHSQRRRYPKEISASYSLSRDQLPGFLLPHWHGSPRDNTFRNPAHPSFFFEQYGFWVGLPATLLALFGLRRLPWLGIPVLLGLCLAFGGSGPVWNFFYEWIPGVGWLKAPVRFASFWVLAAPILAAEGGRLLRPAASALLFLLQIGNLWIWERGWISGEPSSVGRERTAAIRFLKERLGDRRFYTSAEVGFPNKAMLFRLDNLAGWEAIWPGRFEKYIQEGQRGIALKPSGLDLANLQARTVAQASVRYAVAAAGYDLPIRFQDGDLRIYEIPGSLPRARKPDGRRVEARRIGSGEWELRPSAEGAILLAETWMPGWRAWHRLSGAEIPVGPDPASGLWIRMETRQAGPLRLLYRPASFLWGTLLSVCAAFFILSRRHS